MGDELFGDPFARTHFESNPGTFGFNLKNRAFSGNLGTEVLLVQLFLGPSRFKGSVKNEGHEPIGTWPQTFRLPTS